MFQINVLWLELQIMTPGWNLQVSTKYVNEEASTERRSLNHHLNWFFYLCQDWVNAD